MMKKVFRFLACVLMIYFCSGGKLFSLSIESFGIDGKIENDNVVIRNRKPIIHLEYTGTIEKYEIVLSTFAGGLFNGTTVWFVIGSTSTENTLNNIVRVECDYFSSASVIEHEYYLGITVYESSYTYQQKTTKFSVSPTVANSFSSTDKAVLIIDQNNPFSPTRNETTKFRYFVTKVDRNVKIYLFTLSGKFISKVIDHTAIKDVVYTFVWDGKDSEGNILPEGMYVVSLVATDVSPITKFVGIVNKR